MHINIGDAYDVIAPDYDLIIRRDSWIRATLWRHYGRLFRAGDRVLDFGCGTGIDAIFLMRRGVRVTGIDASPGMIAEFRKKAAAEELSVNAIVGASSCLESLPKASFAGIISAFAALNTVPDLDAFAREAHRLLGCGGRIVLHMLAPAGVWEHLECVAQGNLRRLENLRSREKIIAVCGKPIRHTLLPARDLYRKFFAGYFRLRRLYSLGFLWHPHWDKSVPSLIARLGGRVETFLGQYRPFSGWGRFFVLDLQRR